MSFRDNFTDAGKVTTFFFLEIDLTSAYNTEIAAQRSGDLQIQHFMRPSARLLIYAMWPPETHEFDTPAIEASNRMRIIIAFIMTQMT